MVYVLHLLLRVYQKAISPLLAPCCRYYPSCSQYFIDSLSRHGAWKGSYLGLCRIARCNPFFSGGYDPVGN